jgi:hypothetical protein
MRSNWGFRYIITNVIVSIIGIETVIQIEKSIHLIGSVGRHSRRVPDDERARTVSGDR